MDKPDKTPQRSKKGQDLIFAAIVLIGVVVLAMCIYAATRSNSSTGKAEVEPPLSADHEETIHIGSSIPSAQLLQSAEEEEAAESKLPGSEMKWRARKVEHPVKKVLSTYEKDKKVVKPADKKNNGVM